MMLPCLICKQLISAPSVSDFGKPADAAVGDVQRLGAAAREHISSYHRELGDALNVALIPAVDAISFRVLDRSMLDDTQRAAEAAAFEFGLETIRSVEVVERVNLPDKGGVNGKV